MPLLPAGTALFEALPFGALVLDRLAPAVGNGVITLRAGAHEGVLVIRDGTLSEAVWTADGVRHAGDEALALIHLAESATVSACHLSDDAMHLIGSLIRGEPCYAGLRLEWVMWAELLSDLRSRGSRYLVELSTPAGRGVTVIDDGRQIATYVEAQPRFGDPSLLDGLAAAGVGVIRVLSDPGWVWGCNRGRRHRLHQSWTGRSSSRHGMSPQSQPPRAATIRRSHWPRSSGLKTTRPTVSHRLRVTGAGDRRHYRSNP